jgi:hypothetical protein
VAGGLVGGLLRWLCHRLAAPFRAGSPDSQLSLPGLITMTTRTPGHVLLFSHMTDIMCPRSITGETPATHAADFRPGGPLALTGGDNYNRHHLDHATAEGARSDR